MKTKKVLALLMAATMVLGSSMTVWASDATDDGVNTEPSGTETITSIGSAEYVNTNVYQVVLPTSNGLSLTIDPQGLSTIANGGSKTDAELAGAAGKVFTNVASVANQGAKPVKVTASMKLTASNDSDATFVATADDVEADSTTDNNIYAYVVPSGVDTKDASGYLASGKGYYLGTDETKLEFVVPAATYKFTKNDKGETSYDRDTSADEHGTALKVEGLVNKKADWSDFVKDGEKAATKSVTLTTVFEFNYKLEEEDVAVASTLVPFLKADAASKVDLDIESDTTESIAINFTLKDKTTDVVGAIEFTSPNESKGTTTVPAAALTQTPAASTYKKDAYQVTYNAAHDGGTLVIYAKQLATWGKVAASTYKFGGYGQYTVKIDGESYTFTITDPAN
jgi:hypothetical protein